MKTAREIIEDVLNEELDIISDDKRNAVVTRLIEELKLNNVSFLSLNELGLCGSKKYPNEVCAISVPIMEKNENNELSKKELLSAILGSELIVIVLLGIFGAGFVIVTMYFVVINNHERVLDCVVMVAAIFTTLIISNKLGLWGSKK